MAAGSTRTPRAIKRAPIHEQILVQLRQDIIRNRWKPGERLPEPELCEEFGVSRTPMRDALKLLEAEGLIELRPHVGAVVTQPGLPDLEEKMHVLSALEQAAASLLAAQRPARVIAQLRRLHREMVTAAKKEDMALYYQLNDDFHRAIVEGSGNKTLAQIHENIMWHVFRARHMANEHEHFDSSAAGHHEAIVSAIAAGRIEDAELAVRSHLNDVSKVMTRSRKGKVAA
ncbi:GntR family transcriptional regulator [Lacisediminimonas profundi]|uniref:GntR family transcriptional regulator n=1 Tax=Lacisediminimonas profundi TaxID=2603856 RepID=UPI0019D57E88|nr:GntR family transcriptional regulator [Lacisediminimonas profundi]